MTFKGIKMTVKGEKEILNFDRLLDRVEFTGGFSAGFWKIRVSGSLQKPVFKMLDDQRVGGYEFLSEKIYYCYAKSKSDDITPVVVKTRSDYLQVSFCLKGELKYELEENGKIIYEIDTFKANLVYYKCDKVLIKKEESGDFEVLVINIHLGLIEKNFPDLFQRVSQFTSRIKEGNAGVFFKNNISISPSLRVSLQDFISKKYTGCFLNHFVEIKTLELLILLMDESQKNTDTSTQSLNESDIDKLTLAREILIERLTDPPSLKELANLVGTNEFDLKKKFKIANGTTVYNFLQNYKMDLARKMLLESDQRIVDIAEALGYSHATHFTAAFKKATGILPKDFKK